MVIAPLTFVLVSLGLIAAAAPAQKVTLSVPASRPTGASGYVDPDFPGLAFEQASFVEYALNSDGTPNQFSINLIDSIFNRTGGKPLIRLGGTSADYGRYLPGQEAPALPVAEVNNYQNVGNTTIGPSYWALAASFPTAEYIIQLPMATCNISEAVAWATSAADIIGLDRIHSFEPGNEADIYPAAPPLVPPQHQGAMTNESYVGNFTAYTAAVAEAVSLPSATFFQAFDTSVHLRRAEAEDAYIFDVETCFNLGINENNIVKTVAHHYYQTDGGTAATLATGLMNHGAIAAHLDLFQNAIDYLKANHPGIPFVLSEIGNSLNTRHDYSYQATLGSALWQVDFQLYALSIGVARFHLQMIMHSGFDLWLPVESAGMPAQVFSNYYAQPFVADFVGRSREAQVARLELSRSAGDNVVAYGAFVKNVPERVAIINLNYWSASSSIGARPGSDITFLVPAGVRSVTVEHLNSPRGAGASADTITYAGSQWTYESLGTEVEGVVDDTETLTPSSSGFVTVAVPDSAAVLVMLNY